MNRRELVAKINQIAKAHNETAIWTEGGSHTKVQIGEAKTTVPRHNEINEMTAKAILKHLEGGQK